METKGRKKAYRNLPEGLDVPKGLTQDEVNEAIRCFSKNYNKLGKKVSKEVLWKFAILSQIISSEDFPELNSIEAFIYHNLRG